MQHNLSVNQLKRFRLSLAEPAPVSTREYLRFLSPAVQRSASNKALAVEHRSEEIVVEVLPFAGQRQVTPSTQHSPTLTL